MNFLGAISNNMRGSGLEESFKMLYGKKTVEHVMTGKAYKRAVLAHMLVTSALTIILMRIIMPEVEGGSKSLSAVYLPEESTLESLKLSAEHMNGLRELFTDVLVNKVCIKGEVSLEESELSDKQLSCDMLMSSDCLLALDGSLQRLLSILCEQSHTAKLWVQYIRHVDLLRAFLCAERTSNWGQHLNAVSNMLPLFAAQHHSNYAKSGFVYLQTMRELPQSSPWLY